MLWKGYNIKRFVCWREELVRVNDEKEKRLIGNVEMKCGAKKLKIEERKRNGPKPN